MFSGREVFIQRCHLCAKYHRGSGQDDDSANEEDSDSDPEEAAPLAEDEGGEDHREHRGGESDRGEVTDRQSLDCLEDTE